MSDAFSDIGRDEEREKFMNKYFNALADYLENDSLANGGVLIISAQRVDSVKRGYFGKETNITSWLSEITKKLKEKDKKFWGQLLEEAKFSDSYEKLKKLSEC